MGVLYLVSTPIGNREDITLRAIRVLFSVDLIACEDTRKTRNLLEFYEANYKELLPKSLIDKKNYKNLISFYEENEEKRIPFLLDLLKSGKTVGLVSSSGTPTLSDPGFKLVRECLGQNIKVESIPGPSSILAALTTSGLPTDKFFFLGFLPKKQGKRLRWLKNLAKTYQYISFTTVFFESPYRLTKTLNDLKDVFGDIEIVISRELTKIYEEIRKDKISNLLNHFQNTKPKGEFVLSFNIPQA